MFRRSFCLGAAASFRSDSSSISSTSQRGTGPATHSGDHTSPKFHWRGYYDKEFFDLSDRYVLANEVDFEGRTPEPEDQIQVGMVDLQDGDKWIELGTTKAWNWQQGCMLQWIPGATQADQQEVLWNDRVDGKYIAKILSLKTREVRILPMPIYCVSPDGTWGLSVDFRRLNDCRPGYGYAGLKTHLRSRMPLVRQAFGGWICGQVNTSCSSITNKSPSNLIRRTSSFNTRRKSRSIGSIICSSRRTASDFSFCIGGVKFQPVRTAA